MIILSAKYKLGNLPLRDVGRSCHAIIFFGTPHRGSGAAELGMVVANVIGALPGGPAMFKGILRSLEPDSEKLVSITTDFNDIMEENVPAPDKIQIYSFQEGQGYSRITIFDHKVIVGRDFLIGLTDQSRSWLMDHLSSIVEHLSKAHISLGTTWKCAVSNQLATQAILTLKLH